MEEATSAPGERVSIAIPKTSLTNKKRILVVTAEQLQSTRLQQSNSLKKSSRNLHPRASQTNQILDLADQREISTDESTTVNIAEEFAIANVSDLTTQDGELLAYQNWQQNCCWASATR